MIINLFCVGKYSLKGLNLEVERYKKMVSKFCIVKETLIKETPLLSNDEKSKLKKINNEDDIVLKNLKEKSFTILLDDEGESLKSCDLSLKLSKIFENNSNVNFVIGGSYGVGEKVKTKSNLIISLSKLTFSHEVARLVLYEQLFRCFKIINGETYDK